MSSDTEAPTKPNRQTPRSCQNGVILAPISPGLPERNSAELIGNGKSLGIEKPTPPPRHIEHRQALIPSAEAIMRRSSELSEKSKRLSCGTNDSEMSRSGSGPSSPTTAEDLPPPPPTTPPLLPPPLPPRKTLTSTSSLDIDSVPKSPLEEESLEGLGGIENPLYGTMSRRETLEETQGQLRLTEADLDFLSHIPSESPCHPLNSIYGSSTRSHSGSVEGSCKEPWRPSYASTISLDEYRDSQQFSSSGNEMAALEEEEGPDRELREARAERGRRPTPVAQNICFSGWVLMKMVNKKESREKDFTKWFCVLKDKTLSFRHNDTDTDAVDFCHPCNRISYIGREGRAEERGRGEEKARLSLVIQGSQKHQHLKLLVDAEICDTWILLIVKSSSSCDNALEVIQNVERAGPINIKQGTTGDWRKAWLFMNEKQLIHVFEREQNILEHDIRKILNIVEQVSEKSQWCPFVQHSKVGPFLVASEGSSLHIQSESDLVTECWRAELKRELNAGSNRLDHQRLTTKDVPLLVEKCINFISAQIGEEGIHRHSGTNSKVRNLMDAFHDDVAAVEIRREDYSVHDVCSALRKFLRSLDEPLFTKKLKPEFFKVCHLPEADMHKKCEGYERLLGILESEQRVNYATLRKLFLHLKEVTDNCGSNKMTISNASSIFGPSLFSVDCDMEDSFPSFGSAQYEMHVVADLISNYYDVFHFSFKEAEDIVILERFADKMPQKRQAGNLLIPVHFKEYNNQAFNMQDNQTAQYVCEYAIQQHGLPPEDGPYALFEVVRGGRLERMMFPEEKLIDVAINRWQKWSDEDKSANYLLFKKDYVRPRLDAVTPYPFAADVMFADVGSKSFKKVAFQCVKGDVCCYKNNKCQNVSKKWPVENLLWFFGAEPKRDVNPSRSLTFMEVESKPSPKFLGMCMSFKEEHDMYRWLASVLLVQRAL